MTVEIGVLTFKCNVASRRQCFVNKVLSFDKRQQHKDFWDPHVCKVTSLNAHCKLSPGVSGPLMWLWPCGQSSRHSVFPRVVPQGMPGLPGEKGESGHVGLMVRRRGLPDGFPTPVSPREWHISPFLTARRDRLDSKVPLDPKDPLGDRFVPHLSVSFYC